MFNNHLLRYATGAAAPVQIQRSFRMNNFGFGLRLYARFASAALTCGIVLLLAAGAVATAATPQVQATEPVQVTYGTVKVDGLNIAYREAGDPASPKLVLLHGFPASSHQYRDLIPALADRFHVIAPDYPGFGNSDMPDPGDLRLHLRQDLARWSRASSKIGLRSLRAVCAGLRRAGRVPHS